MEAENDTRDSQDRESSESPTAPAGVFLSPIAGFWRRLFAFLIDVILLAILGQVLGWSMSSFWFQIGPYGRILGLAIFLIYFGVMGSHVTGGSTLGKRLMKIAVRGHDGRPIGIMRSIARTSIWVVPVILNGWALPMMSNPIVARLTAVILFGVGGAVILTFVFNHRSRQGLHDLLAHTYVLHLDAHHVAALPVTGRAPWVLTAVMVAIAIVMVSVGEQFVLRVAPQLQSMMGLHQKLQRDTRFFSVGVVDQTFHESGGRTSRVLRIRLWYKGVPTETTRTKVMNEVAEAALATIATEKFDLIRIEIMSAYDLGIATGNVSHYDGQSVSIWRDRVARDRIAN